jgi:hypothetical protein
MISEQLQEDPLLLSLQEKFPEAVESASVQFDQTVLYIAPQKIAEVCEFLRAEHRFNAGTALRGCLPNPFHSR